MIFFFKQKTAYEMRISDWSSDVCSSDLIASRADALRWRQANLAEGVTLGELLSDGSMPVVQPATPAADIANLMIAEDLGRTRGVEPKAGAPTGPIPASHLLGAPARKPHHARPPRPHEPPLAWKRTHHTRRT